MRSGRGRLEGCPERSLLSEAGASTPCRPSGGHAGLVVTWMADDVLVGRAHERDIADDGDEFVTDIPIDDDIQIDDDIRVEPHCPLPQIRGAVDPHAVALNADEPGMQDRVMRGHVVCHEVVDETGIQDPQIINGLCWASQ